MSVSVLREYGAGGKPNGPHLGTFHETAATVMSLDLTTTASIVATVSGTLFIIASLYAFTRWASKQFKDVIRDEVVPMLAPINESLGHLHDCVETIGRETVTQGEATAAAADAARAEATEARRAVAEHVETMKTHIAQDQASFASGEERFDRLERGQHETHDLLAGLTNAQASTAAALVELNDLHAADGDIK